MKGSSTFDLNKSICFQVEVDRKVPNHSTNIPFLLRSSMKKKSFVIKTMNHSKPNLIIYFLAIFRQNFEDREE